MGNELGKHKVWPAFEFSICIDRNVEEIYTEYKLWIPVGDNYHIFFNRKYYDSDISKQTKEGQTFGQVAYNCLVRDVNFLQSTFDPDNYMAVNSKVLTPKALLYN